MKLARLLNYECRPGITRLYYDVHSFRGVDCVQNPLQYLCRITSFDFRVNKIFNVL